MKSSIPFTETFTAATMSFQWSWQTMTRTNIRNRNQRDNAFVQSMDTSRR